MRMTPAYVLKCDSHINGTGPVLIQLPAMLAFKPEKARHFFEYLRANYKTYRFSVEARHPSWTEPPALATGYAKASLTDYARRCREWSAAGHTVWVFFNNDIHGYAIRDALTLKGMSG